MNKLLYISTGLPAEEADRLKQKQCDFSSNALLPICVFHGNILSGLSQHYDEVCALSGVPINRKGFKIGYYKGKQIHKGTFSYVIPGFLNFPVVKQVSTVVKFYWHILCWCKRNKEHTCHILVDGSFYTGLLPLWLASKATKTSIGAIIVDHYPFMEPEGKSISQRIYRTLLGCIDKFIFVTEPLQALINQSKKPYMIMEGLVAPVADGDCEVSVGDYCMYAGGLHKDYGVGTLVDAFHRSDLPYQLHLYGNGDLVEYIRKLSEVDPRIQYKGLLPHDKLLLAEQGAKLLLNPRPVYGKLDTRYNFPSKLMEYMQSGRPVITTRLLGIPQEYDDYMYFFEGDSEDAILNGITQTLQFSEKALSCFGAAAKAYVNEHKNNAAVGSRIFSLMGVSLEE